MGSRAGKATTKPLAVAGRCKPMKVEKPKKPRTHKVKQGTPPKLSASQKRKLVRLYVFTNLSWKDISNLVLHFGRKAIKKRALQYTLQNLLSVQYNQMRPKDTSARRKRASQMQTYIDLRRSKNDELETSGAITQPEKTPLPRATGSRVDDHREANFGTTTEPLNTTRSVERDQYYLNEFDKLIDTQDQDFLPFLDSHRTTPPSSHSTLQQGATISLLPAFAPDAPASYAELLGSVMEHESSRIDESTQTYGTALLETPSANHAIESEGVLSLLNSLPPPRDVDFGHGNLQGFGLPALDTGSPLLLTSEHQLTEGDSQTPPNKPLDPKFAADFSRCLPRLMNHTQDFRVSDHSSISDLSVLVNRLSKCSLGEKQFIKDALRRLSVSTLSSINSSNVSGTSIRLAESFRDRIPFKPVRSLNLPGDFITSNVNTFWDHIACETSLTSRCDSMTFCKSCCQVHVRPGTRETWCIPFAVIQVKRDRLVAGIWCDQGNPWWVDRFGNTSLHIAAALGATYQELQNIIEKGRGASIHVSNSARQTFMHLLNPLLIDNYSLHFLTDYLRRNNFKFDHRDVQGHTFIDSLELRGVDMSHFAEFWPTSVVYSLRRELYDDSRTAKVMPPWSDTWSEAWSYNGSTSLYELLKVPKIVLGRFKHFQDFHGRNCLHIATNKAEKPSDVSEQSFMDSRLSLVRDLLSIGVELDHHDSFGETPLMTLIRTIPSQDDIIQEFLHSGTNVNSRNENGEAALHISVRLGDIVGTKALLAQRATVNVHVRNWKGEGLLAVAVKAQRLARDDVGLYAKITT
ncbi:MAG: hypothetical protein L6R42_005648, partial [Xanthoria sp. 1 TBL-2021]